jgi:gamma-glutamyltranspeptidase/glutathione hydrolase
MLAKGMAALSARFGSEPIGDLIARAEQVARLGVPVSHLLAQDLSVVAQPLLADRAAAAVFGPDGTILTEGAEMLQPDLAATLGRMRVLGVDDLYTGPDAHRLATTTPLAGAFVSLTDLRSATAFLLKPLVVESGPVSVAFPPPPPDGGVAADAAFRALQASPGDTSGAQAHALSAAVHWRHGSSPEEAIAGPLTNDMQVVSLLPASTSFVTLDRKGGAVACALTMNNLFGTGRIAPDTGILLAASPQVAPLPLLAAALAWSPKMKAFRAAAGGSGQQGAALAAADAMFNTLRSGKPMPTPVPEPGRANVIACASYLPGDQKSCGWAADPRGGGLATGRN